MADANLDGLSSWLCVGMSALVLGGYELHVWRAARRDPQATARSAHRVLRAEWVTALSRQAGTEVLAVQTLRNSLMSATITASTAALALMGAVNLVASKIDDAGAWSDIGIPSVRVVLHLALLLTLFAAHVCAAMAMRYYHHAGFVMSMPVASPERRAHEAIAVRYVQRAGVLYSWSLRYFLFVAPLVAGGLNVWLMPVSALALVCVIRIFDRTTEALDE